MPLTARTLARHELVGLPVRVAAASDPTLVGIEGRVVRETANTLVVADEREDSLSGASTTSGASDTPGASAVAAVDASAGATRERDGIRCRQVAKAGTTFEFRLTAPSLAPIGVGGDAGAGTDDGRTTTDDAAGDREAPGTATERSGSSAGDVGGAAGPGADADDGDCESAAHVTVDEDVTDEDGTVDEDGTTGEDGTDAGYVTVDGARLRANPALRTEQTGVSKWR